MITPSIKYSRPQKKKYFWLPLNKVNVLFKFVSLALDLQKQKEPSFKLEKHQFILLKNNNSLEMQDDGNLVLYVCINYYNFLAKGIYFLVKKTY